MKRAFIIMKGTTGAGKSTHGQLLAHTLNAGYISTGDIARKLMDPATRESFAKGGLSPNEQQIRQGAQTIMAAHEIVVIDGAPRNPEQVAWIKDCAGNWDAGVLVIDLKWSDKVLVNRWTDRNRDEFDTLKTFVLRDELYKKEIEPLLPGEFDVAAFSHDKEREIFVIQQLIRQAVLHWMEKNEIPVLRRDSRQRQLLEQFINDHHITLWRNDRMSTFSIQPEDIERKLWAIVDAGR